MVGMMNNFFEKTEAQLDKFVDKMGFGDGSNMRKNVFDARDDFNNLSMGEKMKVTSTICCNNDFKFFFAASHENRDMYIRQILQGEY